MSENDDSTAFLRQRRDLFVISAILLLVPIAEVQIADQISLQQLGMSLYIGRPEIISYALWILWAYWYIRYYQAYKNITRNFYKEKLTSKVRSNALICFRKLALSKDNDSIKKAYNQLKLDVGSLGVRNAGDSEVIEEISFLKAKFNWKPVIFSIESNSNIISLSDDQEITIGACKLIWIRVKALAYVTLNGVEFTEYWLPFIFGLLPPIYCVYKHLFT